MCYFNAVGVLVAQSPSLNHDAAMISFMFSCEGICVAADSHGFLPAVIITSTLKRKRRANKYSRNMQFAATVAIFTLILGTAETCSKFHCYQCMSVEGCKDTDKLDWERCDEDQDVCFKWLDEEGQAKVGAVTNCAASLDTCRVAAAPRKAFWRIRLLKWT